LISVTFLAFEHSDLAHVNQGVIAGLFTSGVIFTTVFFWLFHKEKIGLLTIVGMATIILGVICVGFKPEEH
jgi:drug/metabolite transporter (DMT)-like permease